MWWRSYEDVFGKGNEFAGFENDAARISVYMPLVLPGLLQTRAYMQALLAVGPWPSAWQERAMAARLRRQQILDRADGTAPRLVAVITEASLMYRWGSQAERAAQLQHLTAHEPPAERGVAAAAVRRRAAPGHEQPDRHLRLPR